MNEINAVTSFEKNVQVYHYRKNPFCINLVFNHFVKGLGLLERDFV